MAIKPNIGLILQSLSIEKLNTMQETVLAGIETRRNMLVLSPTGSGKTLAFLLQVLQELDENKEGIQALIIAPARELV
ncbi:MAG TPA: DEAD/DEAH box helicase, partial [Flavobacteriales bacterium]|nr:DEAD/DEAH box helicase [Flavobacteriales bacterium]